MRLNLAAFALFVILGGCAHVQPLTPTSELTVVNQTELPAPVRADLSAAIRPSLIGPLDVINIEVFGAPDLSRELQVDLSGQITMPLLGEIDARGKTPTELSSTIAGMLRGHYMRNPDVTINVKNSVSQVVTVDGQVQAPGLYPVTNQTTLMRAIASAKGLSDLAAIDDVVILRTVDKHRMAGLYNLGAIRRGVYADPVIYADDVVIVGDSASRRLFREILTVAPLLVAPVVALIN